MNQEQKLQPTFEFKFIRVLEQLDERRKMGLVERLLSRYLSQSELFNLAIEKLSKSESLIELAHKAHLLRSSTAQLGFSRLSQFLESLEREGTFSPTLVSLVQIELRRSQGIARAYLNSVVQDSTSFREDRLNSVVYLERLS